MSRTFVPGRDRRAVLHRARTGSTRGAGDRHVIVVGGGIAGIAAAVGLIERGIKVTLVEKHDQLGGRVRSWPVDVHGESGTMSRGFHAFFRQYYNLRALLRRVDPDLQRLVPLSDYPLWSAGGHRDSFAKIPRTPPLNLAAFVLRSPSFILRDLRRVDIPSALELLDVDFPSTFSAYDGESAAHFLDRLRFPSAARHLALEVFARSFFAHPGDFSAGELVAMFHTYFVGSSEGLLFDVPNDDYDSTYWAPLRQYLEHRGAQVITGRQVDSLDLHMPGRVTASIAGETPLAVSGDAVVLATDPATLRRLVDASDELGDRTWRARIAATANAPRYAVLRLWLDRPVDADRAAFLGTSGYGPLDNVTVLERFEEGAARWSRRHGGSVVELHAYALPGNADTDDGELQSRLRVELAAVYPETAAAETLSSQWLVSDDCPLVGTAPWIERPEVATPDSRVVLAGDSIRCDLPVALMERAATTGSMAANLLLGGWGVAGHDLWTVPMHGRLRVIGKLRKRTKPAAAGA